MCSLHLFMAVTRKLLKLLVSDVLNTEISLESQYTCFELQAKLRELGLPVGGKKAELLQRLQRHRSTATPANNNAEEEEIQEAFAAEPDDDRPGDDSLGGTQQLTPSERNLHAAFKFAGIKLAQVKGGIHEQVKRSRINRNDYLQILLHSDKFIACIQDPTKRAKVAAVWKGVIPLLRCACCYSPRITTEVEWLLESKAWMRQFLALYGDENVTPYMHVFVYHTGYFLERYRSVELYANYSLEGGHQVVRWQFTCGTAGFGGRSEQCLATRLLCRLLQFEAATDYLLSHDLISPPLTYEQRDKRKRKRDARLTVGMQPVLEEDSEEEISLFRL